MEIKITGKTFCAVIVALALSGWHFYTRLDARLYALESKDGQIEILNSLSDIKGRLGDVEGQLKRISLDPESPENGKLIIGPYDKP